MELYVEVSNLAIAQKGQSCWVAGNESSVCKEAMTCRPHDGKPSSLNRPARFRGTALRHEKSVQAQHAQTLPQLQN